MRKALAATAIAVLLFAPASWAVDTLGHATSSTFPAGGPASGSTMGGSAMTRGAAPAGTGGGGMFAGDTSELSGALAYIKAHGGGTLVISSQSGAAQTIISSGADVAAIGGFSGSETEVTTQWLANAIASGKIRWVLVSGTGATGGRVGATAAMAYVQKVGKQVSSVSGLYDMSE